MRELVLTGIKELWPEDEKNALFLGPWCFSYHHKYKFWEQKRFNLAPSPWKDYKDLRRASSYVDDVVDKLLPSLSELMNELHAVSLSERFWKVYMVVWLVNWVGICYERYSRINFAGEQFKERFHVKISSFQDYPIHDYNDFSIKSLKGHSYNLILMSDIIRTARFNFVTVNESEIFNEQQKQQQLDNQDSEIDFKKRLRFFSQNVKDYINSPLHLGIIPGITIFDKLYFQLHCYPRRIFKNTTFVSYRESKIQKEELHRKEFSFGARNKFESIVEKILLQHIPSSLLTLSIPKKDNRKKIIVWVGTDIYVSEQYAQKIAEVCEQGGRWVSVQHGGGYGQNFSFPTGKIEFETSGNFITWGWKHKHIYDARYFPLPSPYLSKLAEHKQQREELILVGNSYPTYLYRFYTKITPEELLPYLQDKIIFLKALRSDIIQRLNYRPFRFDYGINELAYLDSILSAKQIISNGKLTDILQTCKLVVVDHLETTFHESFAMNVPTIIYWRKKYFPLYDAISVYFDRLRDAGILYDSPEQAAQKVNEIWENPKAWWYKAEVQEAKNRFCRFFAYTSPNWRRDWVKFLKEFIKESI